MTTPSTTKQSPVSFRSSAVLAAVTYMTFSVSLTLANKYVFSDPDFNFPWMTLSVQSFVVVVCLSCFQLITNGVLFSPVLLRQMFTPCILFSLFLYTNSRALRHLSLPILSVLKSLAPMGIALSERAIFSDVISKPVAFSMVLIIVSNIVTVFNASESSSVGYTWAIMNVILNILHVLSLRICLSSTFTPLEKTLHSNLLALIFMFPLAVGNREAAPFLLHMSTAPLKFRVIFSSSCLLASAIGASIFWFVQETSGSTLSFTGACNKIPVVILGAVLFQTYISPQGWLSVFFGISAGLIFAIAKASERGKTQTASNSNSEPEPSPRREYGSSTMIRVGSSLSHDDCVDDDEFESLADNVSLHEKS